jgi:hypothetical protein
MRDIRLQFFLTLGMLGTVMPYAGVFFRERGLCAPQVGYAFAIQNLVGVLSPAVMTMVADVKIDPRRVLMLMSVFVAIGLVAMRWANGTQQVIAVWTLYCVAQTAIFPLQDGLHFSQQRRRAKSGGRQLLPYHKVRVWGAIGDMTPGVLLFYPLKKAGGLSVALGAGAVFAALAAIQAPFLHDPRPRTDVSPAAETPSRGIGDVAPPRVPTLAAMRMLLEPRMLVFCTAIVLVYMAFSIHWAYYAVYLTEQVKLGNQWVGIANNVAMCVEIPVTFLCGWFMLKLGVKRLVMLGMLLMALRLGLIASTNNPWVAVGTQVFHAFLILAVSIVPHTILDNRAGDQFRHSMQALFVVIVSCGNALTNLWAGRLSVYGLHTLFAIGAALCVAAALLILLMWKDEPLTTSASAKPALLEPPAQPV